MFDDQSYIILLEDSSRIDKSLEQKPHIMFKKEGSFKTEILPAINSRSLREVYGDNYEIFYQDSPSLSFQLEKNGIDYVTTTIEDLKEYMVKIEPVKNRLKK